jgi:hypothetical protein
MAHDLMFRALVKESLPKIESVPVVHLCLEVKVELRNFSPRAVKTLFFVKKAYYRLLHAFKARVASSIKNETKGSSYLR